MLVAWIVLAISSLATLAILVRRFPQAALLDVETISAERQKKVKEQLALARFKRWTESVSAKMKTTFAPVGAAVSKRARGMYERVLSLEKKYQEERRAVAKPLKEEEREQIGKLLDEGRELISGGRYGEAEQIFIKVVGLDVRNVAAYKGLAQIYIETLQFDQAKETIDFLLKLKPGDAESFAMRSEIAYARGDLRVAEEEMVKACDVGSDNITYVVDLAQILFEEKKFCDAAARMRIALEREENNPKYLDFLVESSILCGDRRGAETALERLKAVNPENQKIGEFEGRLKALSS